MPKAGRLSFDKPYFMTTKKTETQSEQEVIKERKEKFSWKKISDKKKILLFSALAAILIIGGGAASFFLIRTGNNKTVTTNTNTKNTVSNKNSNESNQVPRHLDGILVEKGKENNYPVAIMIENLSSIRPQSGLSMASVVYEVLVEGGITRFMALYDIQAQTIKEIGPVRSSRPYYIDWVSEYDALYAHAGGSPEALQAISAFNVKDLNQITSASPNFWRDPKISAPHNLFTSTDLMLYGLRDKGLDKARPTYSPWPFINPDTTGRTETSTARPAQKVILAFSTKDYEVEYNYNADKKTYLRSNGGKEHTDKNTGETIEVKNIAVVVIPEIVSYGEKGRLTLNIHGEGEAHIIHDGQVTNGKWKKTDRISRTQFFDETGKEISFAPGNIWVEVIPKDKTIVIQ